MRGIGILLDDPITNLSTGNSHGNPLDRMVLGMTATLPHSFLLLLLAFFTSSFITVVIVNMQQLA
jgi:hypothetical protein